LDSFLSFLGVVFLENFFDFDFLFFEVVGTLGKSSSFILGSLSFYNYYFGFKSLSDIFLIIFSTKKSSVIGKFFI